LQAGHEKRLAEACEAHKTELQKKSEEMVVLKKEQEAATAKIASEHAAEIASIRASLVEEVDVVKRELAAQTARLQMEAGTAAQSLSFELERVKAEAAAKAAEYQEQAEKLKAQHEAEKGRLIALHEEALGEIRSRSVAGEESLASLHESLAAVKDEAEAQAQEFQEHIADVEEESQQRIQELEKMVLEGKRQVNSLLGKMNSQPDVTELLTKVEALEKAQLDKDLVLLDLKEELERVVKMGNVSNTALLRAQEELEALRAQQQGGVSVKAPTVPEQIRRYEETLKVQHQHNVFLANELNRLETEQQAVLAAKDKTIAFIVHALQEVSSEMRRCRRAALLKEGDGSALVLGRLDSIDDLRKELFFSKAIACKVDRATRGLKTKFNIADLWDRAQHMDTREFDRVIQFELEGTSQSPKKR
jgi:hypothetical protein